MIYLYVKTHNITGMKYFGKTEKENYHSYTGSGKEWKNHLKLYGKNYKTEIIFSSESKEEITNMGRYYSKLWNIVESKEWANLRPESGDGVPIGTKLSEEHKKHLSESLKGKKKSNPENYKKPKSEEHKRKISEAHKGKSRITFHCVNCENDIPAGNFQRWHGDKCKGKRKYGIYNIQ